MLWLPAALMATLLLAQITPTASGCAMNAMEAVVLHVDNFVKAGQPLQHGVQAAIDAAIKRAKSNPTAGLRHTRVPPGIAELHSTRTSAAGAQREGIPAADRRLRRIDRSCDTDGGSL